MTESMMPLDNNGVSMQVLTFGSAATLDGTSASTQSAVLSSDKITVLMLKAHADVWVKIGSNPTAQEEGTCTPLSSGETAYIYMPIGTKIAVYGGKLTYTICY